VASVVRIHGQSVVFPDVCANCLQPASDHAILKAQRALGRHREAREVEIPLCSSCYDLYQGHTPFHRAAEAAAKRMPIALSIMVASGIVTLISAVTGLVGSLNVLASDRPAWPWIVAGTGIVFLGISSLIWYLSRRAMESPLPQEEVAARDCVRILDFSPDITTFRFGNDAYADRFLGENPGSSLVVG